MRICSAKQKGKEKGEEDAAFGTVIVTGANTLPTTTSSVDENPEMGASRSGNEDSSNLLKLVKSITTKGLNVQAYIKRAELLSGIFKAVQLKSGALQISAQCPISTVIEKLLSWVIFRPQKALTSRSPHVSANPKSISVPLHSRQIPQEKCSVQGKFVSYRLGELLWIDTDLGRNATEFPLCEFPSNMMLQGQRFTLRAIIAFRAGLTQDALGHYVAYCRKSPCVWEMYDNLRSGVTGASENNKICPHAVFYTKD
ncbi:uncharacterized [Tachysurus ichikawai]